MVYKIGGINVGPFETRIVHRFCSGDGGCTAGAYPTAGLPLVGGVLYGTTSYLGEGNAGDCGAIYRLDE